MFSDRPKRDEKTLPTLLIESEETTEWHIIKVFDLLIAKGFSLRQVLTGVLVAQGFDVSQMYRLVESALTMKYFELARYLWGHSDLINMWYSWQDFKTLAEIIVSQGHLA